MYNKIIYISALIAVFFISSVSAETAFSQNKGNEDKFNLTAFPNPSSSSITINYQLPQKTVVKLMIYSADGSIGKVLFAGTQAAGEYKETYDISSLASGQYFYQLQTDTELVTKPISMTGGSAKGN